MEHEELLEAVRGLRRRRYSPAEIARVLGLGKAEAARLVRIVACERDSASTATAQGATNDRAAGSQIQCWVSPGWRHGLRIEGTADWPDDAGAPTGASDSGVALVLVAAPDGHHRLSVCGYLVDTWCLGVKNALGPKRMARRDFDELKRVYFAQWGSPGIPIPVELAQHLVFGAVQYARRLGFEPHRDFRRASRLLGSWSGPSAIMFGREGKPYYVNGPYEDPERVLATLERTVGRGGFHYTVSLDELGGLHDGYRYTVSVTDMDELGDAA
jgi:hypothetical protein